MVGELYPPFIGREAELEAMMGFLSETISGRGSLILIAGEAGIGKTRISEEFKKKAFTIGCYILSGRCIPGAPRPLLPFEEAVRTFNVKPPSIKIGPDSRGSARVRNESSAGFENAVPPLFSDQIENASIDMEKNYELTMFSMLEFLKKRSTVKPIILELEDIHWADSLTVQLIHFLARNIRDLRVMIIATYRPEDIPMDSNQSGSNFLLDAFRLMRREGVCRELGLARLTRNETEALVRGTLGGSLEAEFANRISRESEGNPLFTLESVRWLLSTGVLVREGEIWRIKPKTPMEMPTTVKEVILRRIERISLDCQRVIECGSVIGYRFDPETVIEVLGKEKMLILELLEELERNTQLVVWNGDTYQFSHESIRRVAYDSISALRRKELHFLVGISLESRMPKKITAGELSAHFHNAGVKEKAIRYSIEAADEFMKVNSGIDAVPYFERALENAKDQPEYLEYRLKALWGLGEANVRLGNSDTAIRYMNSFLNLTADPSEKAKAAIIMAWAWGPVELGKGDSTKSHEWLKKAEHYGIQDLNFLGELYGYHANLAMWEGQSEEADVYFSKSEQTFEAARNYKKLILQLSWHSTLHLGLGKIVEALATLEKATEFLNREQFPEGEMEISYSLGLAYFHQGKTNLALDEFAKCANLAIKLGNGGAYCWSLTNRAFIFEMYGDYETAWAEANKARSKAHETESPFYLVFPSATLIHVLVRKRCFEEAEELGDQLLETMKDFSWSIHSTSRGVLTAAIAELEGYAGELEKCDNDFEKAIEYFHGTPEGLLFEGIVRKWWGEVLLSNGEISKALIQLRLAVQLFEGLGNSFMISLTRRKIPDQ